MKQAGKILRGKRVCIIALAIVSAMAVAVPSAVRAQSAPTPPEPVVAIHVSELTQALETTPAVSPTPTGPGTTGFEWWYTSWHYFVAYESLKEALRSDGTSFVEVSDAAIASGVELLGPSTRDGIRDAHKGGRNFNEPVTTTLTGRPTIFSASASKVAL